METSNLNGISESPKNVETQEKYEDIQLQTCKTVDADIFKEDASINGINIEKIDVCVAEQLSDDEEEVSNDAKKEPDVALHEAECTVNNGEASVCTSSTNTLSQDVAKSFCLRHDGTEERVKLVTSYDLECVNAENDDTEKLHVTEDVIVRDENTCVYNRDDLRMKTSVNHEHVGEHWVSRNMKTYETLPFTNIDKLMTKSGCEGSVFHDLPDELIVKIFSYLTTKELCQNVAPICRKWRQISLDHSLWKSLDFSTRPHLSSLNFLWVMRRAPLLKRLFISGRVNVTRAEVAILTESCPGIQEIDFGFCDNLTCDMLQCLPENCQDLRKINVEGCDKLENRTLKYLVKCKKLSHLNFSHCMFLQDSGIIFLAGGLPEIKSINLDGISFLTDRGVKGLVDSHYLYLEEVELDGAEISDVGLEQLSRCKQLKHLGISFCECLTDQSLEYLKELKNLVYLRLRKGSDFSSDGLSSFFKEASLSKLQVLNLSECSAVNDQVVLDMSQACGSHLKELSLSWCWFITDTGLISIVDHCCNMENLDLLGIDRIYGECLSRVPEEMTKLKFLDLRQCNQILDNLIVDMVRRKKDLKVINYYGEEFVHD
ncbi:F-box/LRR-repeat protein fbxl-1-like [Mercenaria mercenaria]|uniref:F-box/LRR-repeat protein fbxl-1-like n=1 Tax=Mercenaria mercenaria TaxID=6596 RepID=UPI00234E8940|nr:F-box/LRR-repeat protein fbxl-1-like [Mercenaria mercenaria]XP_045205173.2 F-box/LRR-repeat protein fbxl-1-like [Mercenaria mercenaria]